MNLERGVFTLSLDFELIWGTVAEFGEQGFQRQCQLERRVVIDRLLALLVEFEIPATWCVVGHLMLADCDAPASVRRGRCGGEDCLYCGRALIEKIRACAVPQEIGCHSFTHPLFSEHLLDRAAAARELDQSVKAARELGIEMQSFVFPQNRTGHLGLLKDYGITCYRGPEPHEDGLSSEFARRLAHLWAVCTAAQPPVHLPEFTAAGVWNIPGSMIYFPMHGRRRYLPLNLRVKRAIKGLEAAAQQRRIFHLWFHPTNLADEMEHMFRGLREIFTYAADLRARGSLDFVPMGKLVPALEPALRNHHA